MKHSNTPSSSKHTSLQSRYREAVNENGYELMGAYVAGIMDSTASISVSVSKQVNTRIGYTVVPQIKLQRRDQELISVVDNWALERGIRGTLRELEQDSGTKYKYTIQKREDVETFLTEIEPYIIVRHNVIQIILNEIMPRLNDGTHKTKEGFIETVEYADMVRDMTGGGEHKYDAEYFREEWSAEI